MEPATAKKGARPHPYAEEASGGQELRAKPQNVAALVVGSAALLAIIGIWLQSQYGFYNNRSTYASWWEDATLVPLFGGLTLLGLGLLPNGGGVDRMLRRAGWGSIGLATIQAATAALHGATGWTPPGMLGLQTILLVPDYWPLGVAAAGALLVWSSRRVDRRHVFGIAGWVLFGTYWALTARDLLVTEGQDYVNFVFALVGVLLTLWLAYHVWLDRERGTRDDAVRFLQVSVFVAAGFYFLIDKIQFFRENLIGAVAAQTKMGLDVFGQGSQKGLVFTTQYADSQAPTRFYYPDTVMKCPDGTPVPSGLNNAQFESFSAQCPSGASNAFQEALFMAPGGEGLAIVPVNIILACTALQSIMLFVGLFAGTRAHWQKILGWSLVVGSLVYVLNLVRNVGIIWFYGQGHASFWMMHNAIGKGGSLVAILLIAMALFKWFPEFFRALVGVLDLVDRDGPLERALRIGRRRPDPAGSEAATDVVPSSTA